MLEYCDCCVSINKQKDLQLNNLVSVVLSVLLFKILGMSCLYFFQKNIKIVKTRLFGLFIAFNHLQAYLFTYLL